MFNKEKLLLGIEVPSNNLEGWSLSADNTFTREGYCIQIDLSGNKYILDPKGKKLKDSYSDTYHAIAKVNDLLKPFIEFEYKDIRFPLVPLDFNKLESVFNKDVTVYSKNEVIGTINMECDDVPSGVGISDMSNPILLALKNYLNSYLDD